jgi:hypothetical protein
LPTEVDVSSEDEYHGALAATTGNDILDGSHNFDNKSIHGGFPPAEYPQRVILDSDDDQQSQECLHLDNGPSKDDIMIIWIITKQRWIRIVPLSNQWRKSKPKTICTVWTAAVALIF